MCFYFGLLSRRNVCVEFLVPITCTLHYLKLGKQKQQQNEKSMASHGMPRHAKARHGMPWQAMASHGMPRHAKACHGMPKLGAPVRWILFGKQTICFQSSVIRCAGSLFQTKRHFLNSVLRCGGWGPAGPTSQNTIFVSWYFGPRQGNTHPDAMLLEKNVRSLYSGLPAGQHLPGRTAFTHICIYMYAYVYILHPY